MKPDAIVIGAVLVAVAATALFLIWLQSDDALDRAMVQGLAGPQPASTPPAILTASTPPTPAASAGEPLSASVLFEFDRSVLRETEAAKLDRLLQGGFKRIEAVGLPDAEKCRRRGGAHQREGRARARERRRMRRYGTGDAP